MLENQIDNNIKVTRYQLFQQIKSIGFMDKTRIPPFIEFYVTKQKYDQIMKENKGIYLRDPFDTYIENVTLKFLEAKAITAEIIGYEKNEHFDREDEELTTIGYYVHVTINNIEPLKITQEVQNQWQKTPQCKHPKKTGMHRTI